MIARELQLNRGDGLSKSVWVTLLTSSVLACLEYVVFEPMARHVALAEWVFYKTSLLGPSLLLSQMLSFCALALMFFTGQLVLVTVFLNRPNAAVHRILPVTSNGLVVLAVVALRIVRYRDQGRLALLFLVVSLVVVAVISRACWLRRRQARDGVWQRRGLGASGLIVAAALALVFFLPDVYSLAKYVTGGRGSGPPPKPNILLIVTDTVRADHMSCYGYGKTTTPEIDSIASESLVFDRAYSTAPWTVPAHASVFTGLYPSQHNAVWGHVYLEERFTTLTEHLSEAGYRTAAFVENPYLSRSVGFSQGFDEYHEMWRRPLLLRTVWKVMTAKLGFRDGREYAARTFPLVRRWIRNNAGSDAPFFVFVNLMAAHLPSYPRPEVEPGATFDPAVLEKIEPVNLVPERYYLEQYRLSSHELEVMRNIYDQELRFLDSHVGETVDFLRDQALLEDLVIILTSDHGENFGDHGLIEHQYCLYDTLIRVPLIIRVPSATRRARLVEPISTRRLFHWIRDEVVSTDLAARQSVAVSTLTQAPDELPIFAEHANAVQILRDLLASEDPAFDFSPFDATWRSVQRNNYKYIWSSRGDHELYDVASDPCETTNLIQRQQDVAVALQNEMQKWLESVSGGDTARTGTQPPVDPETEEALRALGYVH